MKYGLISGGKKISESYGYGETSNSKKITKKSCNLRLIKKIQNK